MREHDHRLWLTLVVADGVLAALRRGRARPRAPDADGVAAALVGLSALRERVGRGGRRLVADRRRRAPHRRERVAVRARRRPRRPRDARAQVAREPRDRAAAVRRCRRARRRRDRGHARRSRVVAAWSIEAVVLAWAGRRTDTPERGLVASLLFAGLAARARARVRGPPDVARVRPALDPAWRSAPSVSCCWRSRESRPRTGLRGASRLGRRRARGLPGERPRRRSCRRARRALDPDVAARALGLLGSARLRRDPRRARSGTSGRSVSAASAS